MMRSKTRNPEVQNVQKTGEKHESLKGHYLGFFGGVFFHITFDHDSLEDLGSKWEAYVSNVWDTWFDSALLPTVHSIFIHGCRTNMVS